MSNYTIEYDNEEGEYNCKYGKFCKDGFFYYLIQFKFNCSHSRNSHFHNSNHGIDHSGHHSSMWNLLL